MNIILKICGILLIALQIQQPVCSGHFYLGFTSGAVTLVQAIMQFVNSFMDTPTESKSFIITATENMVTNLQQGIDDLKEIAKHNQNVMELLLKKEELRDNMKLIQHALNECRSKITNIAKGRVEDEAEFIKLENEYDLQIKRSYSNIISILTRTEIMTVLDDYFSVDLQVFEHVCNTGISQIQLLEHFLISLTDVTSQFYAARYMILDLVKKYGGRQGIDITMEIFIEEVLAQFTEGVNQLKMRMRKASRDIYACDKRLHDRDVRYQNGSGYYELVAFQKYIFNQNDALGSIQSCRGAPECGTIKKIVGCNKGNVPCDGVRSCKRALLDCDTMTDKGRNKFYACVSGDASAIARYSSVVPEKRKRNDFSCPSENERTLSSTVFYPESTPGQSQSVNPGDLGIFCDVCKCICPDTIYYISTEMEWTTHLDEVLTGVRFRMKDNTLYIQAQYGVLLPNARVNETTLYWSEEPKNFGNKVEISWNGIRGFDLTTVTIPKDYVMIGLRFDDYTNDRVRLRAVAQKFNFTSGTIVLSTAVVNKLSPGGREEFDLSNLDVPTKSPAITTVKSKGNQFIKFTTTSEIKDGGQTTIPFIENLDVVSKLPVPMGGVGLVYKASKEGYGGFLALKLLTYSVEPHIEIPKELPLPDINAYIENISSSVEN